MDRVSEKRFDPICWLTVALILSAVLCPLVAYGQCIDYRDYLHLVGSVDTPDKAYGVAVSGNYAYVADRLSGLQVVDVSDPASPEIVGSVVTPGWAWDVALSGNYAYVADRWSGLQMVDVSDPASPVIVGSVDTPCEALDVVKSGNYAYVAAGACGLLIVDVSNPAFPVIVGSVDTPCEALAVVVSGSHAYVAAGACGLLIVDVSNPAFPVIVGSVDTPDEALSVAVSGSYAYVAGSGLQVVDVSNPSSPQVVGSVGGTWSLNVAVSGSYAYVTGSSLRVVDVSDPASPGVVGSASCDAYGVAVAGSYAYVTAEDSGFQVVDVSNPASAVEIVGSVSTQYTPYGVAVSGSYAYLVSDSNLSSTMALYVIDASDPASPQVVGFDDYAGWDKIGGVAVSGNYVYFVLNDNHDRRGAFRVVDVSDPTLPQGAGGLHFDESGAQDVAISGSYAYVTYNGLQVVDVSTPESCEIVGSVNAWGWVAVSGSYAYVAGSSLRVVDVSDPASPEIVGSVDMPASARDVAVAGSYAYVADRYSGLQIVDVSNPASPVIVGSVDTPDQARGVAISGSYAYVATYAYVAPGNCSRLLIVDVSNPASPAIVGGRSWERDYVAVSGSYAYGGGLSIVPAQCDEPTPVTLSGFTAEVRDRAVEVSWFTSFEYLHDGFNVYRSRLVQSGYAKLNERLVRGRSPYSYLDRSVQPSTTYYYKLGAVDSRGHEVLHFPTSVTTPAWGVRTALSAARPSPFRSKTLINFTLATAAEAKLAVYDVAGRLVRALVHEELPAGDHSVTWDGRDDAGLRVAGGTYFVKLTAGNITRTRKVVFLGDQ